MDPVIIIIFFTMFLGALFTFVVVLLNKEDDTRNEKNKQIDKRLGIDKRGK